MKSTTVKEAKKPLWGWIPQAHNGLQYMRRGKEQLGPFNSYGEAKAAVRKLELSQPVNITPRPVS